MRARRPSHTWLAIGIQGLAPQFLDVQATAFVGPSGHTAARIEVEHDLLLTQRLVLQPLVELSLSGKDDPDRGIGAGLSTGEVGFRVRYESGANWRRTRAWSGTASCSAPATPPASAARTPAAGTSSAASLLV